MRPLKQLCDYLVVEPLTWLFYYIFQPGCFRKGIEQEGFTKRLLAALRLAFPLFLCSFWLSLLIRMVLYTLFPDIYDLYFPPNFLALNPDILQFWLNTLWVTVLCIAFGVALMVIFGFVIGTTVSVAMTLASGICIQASYDVMVAITFGTIFGLLSGLTFTSTRTITRRSVIGMITGVALGILGGSGAGILGGFWGGMIVGVVGGQTVAQSFLGSVGGAIVGGILGGSVTSLLMRLANKCGRGSLEIGEVGTHLGLILSGTFAITVGISTGDVGLKARTGGVLSFANGIGVGIAVSIGVGVAFLVSYILGYCRLPLYPVSTLSAWKAYRASLKDPKHVFVYLQHSSLHWDERILFPLPFLSIHLRFALEQDKRTEQILDEVAFIAIERPTQIKAAKAIALEIVIHALEMCSSLLEIRSFSERFAKILPPEIALIDPRGMRPFDPLYEASIEIAHYYDPLSWEMKRDALKGALHYLEKAFAEIALKDSILNERLEDVVKAWQQSTQQALVELEQMHDAASMMSNPFIVGASITPDKRCFVGRRDLAQQMVETLRGEQYHPVLLLNGERHMGKSSFLLNLTDLLGERYIPVIYNMQSSSGSRRSISVFLQDLAKEIRTMAVRGGKLRVRDLEYPDLQEACERDEMAVYRVFDRWLKTLENKLKRNGKILLVAFDEFEAFEDRPDLEDVLAYFRSVIEHSQHIVLLFCGRATFEEVQASWTRYFERVLLLKMSFLHPQEAFQLITKPTPSFQAKQVFSEEVAWQIIEISARHPFFLQGICSVLIEYLNREGRFSAQIQDVILASNMFLEKLWGGYFLDLWQSTNVEQRKCLDVLTGVKSCDEFTMQQATGLGENILQHTLEALCRRDLIAREQGYYRIAAPILREWVTHGKQWDERQASIDL